MQTVVATCAPEGAIVLSDWCNDNERLLRAMGFRTDKEQHKNLNYHQNKYIVSLNPCILVAPPEEDECDKKMIVRPRYC